MNSHSFSVWKPSRAGNWIWDPAPLTSLVSIYNIMIELWGDAAMRWIQSIQFNFPKWVKPHKIPLGWLREGTGNVERWLSGRPHRTIIPHCHRDIDFSDCLEKRTTWCKIECDPGLSPYPRRVLLHLVLVAMGTICMATPEAALTELVAMALLAPIPETHHALAPAIGTFHRMEDWAGKNNNKEDFLSETSLLIESRTKISVYS